MLETWKSSETLRSSQVDFNVWGHTSSVKFDVQTHLTDDFLTSQTLNASSLQTESRKLGRIDAQTAQLVQRRLRTESVLYIGEKTVRILAYSSTREQSNKRSGARLKTEARLPVPIPTWHGKRSIPMKPFNMDPTGNWVISIFSRKKPCTRII